MQRLREAFALVGRELPFIDEVGKLRNRAHNFGFGRAIVRVEHLRRALQAREAEDVALRPGAIVHKDHLAETGDKRNVFPRPAVRFENLHAIGQILRDADPVDLALVQNLLARGTRGQCILEHVKGLTRAHGWLELQQCATPADFFFPIFGDLHTPALIPVFGLEARE